MSAGDMHALKKFAAKHEINFDRLSDEDKEKYNQFKEKIFSKYKPQLEAQPLPLPEQYFEDLADRAIQLGNFTTAHSALQVMNKLEKKVNEYVVKGIQLLQSKEMKSSSSEAESELYVQQAADHFYNAIRIKNPLGNQFQYLATNLHFKDVDALRKYFKYVELNLLKEIIEFCIQYLTDDKIIANKIVENLPSAKTRKMFLRFFAEQYSFGNENYQKFVSHYKEATQLLKEAKEYSEILKLQKILLGRGTGDNEYYQFLRELATEHPISALLVAVATTSDGTPFIAPIILKSTVSLMEFLELDK